MGSLSKNQSQIEIATSKQNFHIFGNGISFSISPTIHNAGFKYYGLPYLYDIREIESMGDAAEFVNAPNFGGASVTMPHKLEAHKFCQEQTESAHLIGAINTLIVEEADDGKRKIIGDNTDWSGLHSIINTHYDETGIEPPRAGLVIGAGGAARAALYAMHRSGIQHIYLVNRTVPNAEKVKDAFSSSFDITVLPDLQQLPQSPGVIIGTVPAETTCENEFHQLFSSNGGLCIEMSYKPPHTPLMAAAGRHAGWRTLSGVDVLLAQAFDQFRLWTGLEPPKAQMIEAIQGEIVVGYFKDALM